MHEVLAVVPMNIFAWNVTMCTLICVASNLNTHIPCLPVLFTFSHERFKLEIKEHNGSTVMESDKCITQEIGGRKIR
jgi:hypothetical protein